jgi:uncharacterized small protein (DUF1192 family)
MAVSDEDAVFGARPVKPASHVVGENVDALSVGELDARIAALRGGDRTAAAGEGGARGDASRGGAGVPSLNAPIRDRRRGC